MYGYDVFSPKVLNYELYIWRSRKWRVNQFPRRRRNASCISLFQWYVMNVFVERGFALLATSGMCVDGLCPLSIYQLRSDMRSELRLIHRWMSSALYLCCGLGTTSDASCEYMCGRALHSTYGTIDTCCAIRACDCDKDRWALPSICVLATKRCELRVVHWWTGSALYLWYYCNLLRNMNLRLQHG